VSRQQKPSRQVSVDEQIQVVLAVVKGESSLAGAARRHGVSSATVQLRIHHARPTSPPSTAISVWPLADPLLDREVPI
jgi:transposase-like protein